MVFFSIDPLILLKLCQTNKVTFDLAERKPLLLYMLPLGLVLTLVLGQNQELVAR